jgi:hypothetical protein
MTTNNTYTPYRAMQEKLEQLKDFRGCSVTAVTSGEFYTVSSYDTPILILSPTTRFAAFNNKYYSKATSIIQNKIKDAFGLQDCTERIIHFANI